jgi:hypothetical protein
LSYIPGSSSVAEPAVNGQVLVWEDITGGAGLTPGNTIEMTFDAQVPVQIGTYVNEATVVATYPGGTVSDSDDASLIVEDPSVAIDKYVAVPGMVNGVITFTINITNTGPSTLDIVPLFDNFAGPIEYIGGNVPADQVDNVNQTLAWNDLTENLGDMAPGQVYRIDTVFRLTDEDITDGDISNTAQVDNAEDILGNAVNDDSDAAVTSIDPTAIELLSFTATYREQDILVRWVTGAEINTWGFHLLRSPDGTRANATRVTPTLIPGRGRSTSGATYTWVDKDIIPDQPYTYWLEETELDGTIIEYGPASARYALQSGKQVFLPFVSR